MGIDVACMKGVSIMIVVTVTGPALGRALGGRAGLSVEKKARTTHACMCGMETHVIKKRDQSFLLSIAEVFFNTCKKN